MGLEKIFGKDKYFVITDGIKKYDIGDINNLTDWYCFATDGKTAFVNYIPKSKYEILIENGKNYIVFDDDYNLDYWEAFKLLDPTSIFSRKTDFQNNSDITPENLNLEFNNIKDLILDLQETMNVKSTRIDNDTGKVMLPPLKNNQMWIGDEDKGYTAIDYQDLFMQQDLDMKMHKIINLADGENPNDAVNKKQLDEKLSLDGSDRMHGNLHMGLHQVIGVAQGDAFHHAVNKRQLDKKAEKLHRHKMSDIDGIVTEGLGFKFLSDEGKYKYVQLTDNEEYLRVDGSRAMQGHLSLGSYRITNLRDGISDYNAVNLRQLNRHNHDGVYSPIGHDHDSHYSPVGHDHDSDYSDINHNHDGVYAPIVHDHNNDYFKKTEFITESTGIADAGKPIVLNANGELDDTLIPDVVRYYVGGFTPTSSQEYPDTTGENYGATWSIEGVDDIYGYEFTTGNLAGKTVYNADLITWGTTGWGLIRSQINPDLYLLLDGSKAMTGHLSLGNNQIISLADGTNSDHAVNKKQLDGKSDLGHNHDTTYSPLGHDHDSHYSPVGHDHDEKYSQLTHNHDTQYASVNHDHDVDYSPLGHNHDERYPLKDHNHDSDYSDINHNHDGVYSPVGHEHNSDYFQKSEFITGSTGIADAGKPIVLNANGELDESLISDIFRYFVGEFTPTSSQEYPDTTGENYGATWSVAGVDSTNGYTFTTGNLVGRTAKNNDLMTWGATGWGLISSQLDPTKYLRLDGTKPMEGNLSMGLNKITNLSDGTELSDAVNKGQLDTKSDSNHNHDTAYSPIGHRHDGDYSPITHDHDSDYSNINHNHDGDYSSVDHLHDDKYSQIGHNHDERYPLKDHNHDSDYSDINHNHDGVYSPVGHEHNSDYFQKSEFVDVSHGNIDAGKPIKLNFNGELDGSLIPDVIRYYVGGFTPTSSQEYPDTTGENYGGTWDIEGVDDTNGYTYTTGNLTGRTVYNGDLISWGSAGWGIFHAKYNPDLYLLLDGSKAMTGHLSLGNNQIISLADGTNSDHAVNKGQLDSGLDSKLSLSGGNMSGSIDMGDNQITNIGSSTAPTDVTRNDTQGRVLNWGQVGLSDGDFAGLDVEGAFHLIASKLSVGQSVEGRVSPSGNPNFLSIFPDIPPYSILMISVTGIDIYFHVMDVSINLTVGYLKLRNETDYVSNTGFLKILLETGGTMSGSIDMNSNPITNLPAPTNPTDAQSSAGLNMMDWETVGKDRYQSRWIELPFIDVGQTNPKIKITIPLQGHCIPISYDITLSADCNNEGVLNKIFSFVKYNDGSPLFDVREETIVNTLRGYIGSVNITGFQMEGDNEHISFYISVEDNYRFQYGTLLIKETAHNGLVKSDFENIVVSAPYYDDPTPHETAYVTVRGSKVLTEDNANLHEHDNKPLLDSLTDLGDGTQFLSNDGSYKTISVNTDEYMKRDGSTPMTGNLDMGNNSITNLASSTNSSDVTRNDTQGKPLSWEQIGLYDADFTEYDTVEDALTKIASKLKEGQTVERYCNSGDLPNFVGIFPDVNETHLIISRPKENMMRFNYFEYNGEREGNRRFYNWGQSGFVDTGEKEIISKTEIQNMINSAVSGCLPLDGSRAMTGSINMGSNKITGVSDGTESTDAVNFGQIANAGGGVPIGTVVMYSGDGSNLGSDWAICDGGHGTPDLRNKFIRATDINGIGNTGGSDDAVVVSHGHTATDSGHTHSYTTKDRDYDAGERDDQYWLDNRTVNTSSASGSITINSEGVDGTGKNIPSYYALAYIMKIA